MAYSARPAWWQSLEWIAFIHSVRVLGEQVSLATITCTNHRETAAERIQYPC